MGLYINPKNVSKEEWLKENGMSISCCPNHYKENNGYLYVCLVDNGPFSAAGVAYNQKEFMEFFSQTDTRPKKFYAVPIVSLEEVCPDFSDYYKEN